MYPKMHISIRVPWHDSGWNGRVCANPRLNGACLKLKSIGEKRDDEAEELAAGKSLEELPPEKWPCCVAERGMFMSPFEYTRVVNHPYKDISKEHEHFAPTSLRHPAYSAPAVPFGWMLWKKKGESICKAKDYDYDLDVDPQREPDLKFETSWVQALENQKAISDCFLII